MKNGLLLAFVVAAFFTGFDATARAGSSVVVVDGDNIVQSSTGSDSSNVVIVNGQQYLPKNAIQSPGPEKTDVRALVAFATVQLSAPVEASFTVGPTTSISITGPANILPLVLTTVQDGKLSVSIKESVALAKPLKVAITGPSLQGVRIHGSGTMKLSGINGESLDLRISGSGSIVAAGRVNGVRIDISGSGDVDASAVHARTLDAEVSGSGDVRAYASESATVDLSGSGDIHITGKPTRRSVDRSGSGEVRFD